VTEKPSWLAQGHARPVEEDLAQEACPQWRGGLGGGLRSGFGHRLPRPLGVVFALLAVSLGFVSLLLWLQPPPSARLVLIGAGYEENLELPQNVPGRRALEQLEQMAASSSPWSAIFPRAGRLCVAQGVQELRANVQWPAAIADGPERTLVVFVAAHAGADPQGAYLLPAEAGGDPSDRLRVEQLLDRLAALPAHKHKLLILDGTRIDQHWSLGMLQNDFVRALLALEPRIAAIPNLVVLTSSDADQLSWDRGLDGTTVFADFLIEGLCGAAQPAVGSRVTAWDLHTYVREQVSRWVRTYRHAEQTPLLLPRSTGAQRARAIPLAFRLSRPALPARADPLPAIAALWQRLADLRAEAPAAVLRSPAQWKRLEGLTLRHEQLMLAGDRLAVETIRDLARETEEQIRRHQHLPLTSAEATLATAALGGEIELNLPEPYDPFDRLWQARPADRLTLWAKLQNAEGSGPREQARLRRRLFHALVRHAASDPRRNLAQAADLALFIHEACGGILPAEAHLLVMLNRDLPQPLGEQGAALVCRALRIRLLAERAALCVQPGAIPYAEQIVPWIRTHVEAADADRRLGEDLLLATEPDDLARAGRYFDQAEQHYQRAAAEAAVVRLAFEQRDRALYELFWYACWAARLRASAPQDTADTIVDLWRQTHELGHMLRQGPAQTRISEMNKLAEQLRQGCARLRDRFDERVRTAATETLADPDNLFAVLDLPLVPWTTRADLLRRRIQLERRALEGLATQTPAPMAHAADPQGPRVRARRRGQLALAALGARVFEAGMAGAGESYAQICHRLETFAVEEQWWRSLGKVGDEIGQCWRWLAAEPPQLTERARRQRNLAQARQLLWEADQLVRRSLTAEAKSHSSATLRALLAGQGLLFQATRIAADRWADEHVGAAPYYQTTAHALLGDARLCLERHGLSLNDVAELETRLRDVGTLELQATPQFSLTAGESTRLTLSVAAPPGAALRGFPVVWGTVPAGAGADALQLAALAPGHRTVLSVGLEPAVAPLRVDASSPLLERLEASPPDQAAALQSGVDWVALHRGFRVTRRTAAVLYPCAAAVQRWQAPPQGAAVAVAAERNVLRRVARARGALTVVLDCSGSMGPPSGQPSFTPTRFQLVTRALRALLSDTPPGTTFSLWVFGQAIGAARTVEPVERTIMRLQDPIVWNGDPGQVRALMARVEQIVPWNESPVVRALLAASEDLLHAQGPRTLLVLTDGIDNRFAKDREANPGGQSVADALRERFRGSGIAVHVVGFQVACAEEAEAHRQFSVVEQLDPPGSFCTVGCIDDLMAAIYRVGNAVLEYGLASADVPDVNFTPVAVSGTVSAEDEELRWQTVFTGGRTRVYQLELLPSKQIAGDIVVAPGDTLSLRLVPRAPRFGLERLPFVRRGDLPSSRIAERGGWVAAVPQYEASGAGGLRLLVTLEPQAGSDESFDGNVRLRRPADVWMELSAANGQPVATRWGPVAGYPASAWTFDASAWPVDSAHTPVPAKLCVWWLSDRPTQRLLSLRRPTDFDAPESLARTVSVEGGTLTIDSVCVELHQLPRDTLGRPTPRWCIAVRITHPADKPLRASLEGLEGLAGEEHRYYREAGKYVALFWFAGLSTHDEIRDRLHKDLRVLHLTSLTALRKAAAAEGHAVEFLHLGRPAVGSVPPRQPVALD
jgi:hypothetical protein